MALAFEATEEYRTVFLEGAEVRSINGRLSVVDGFLVVRRRDKTLYIRMEHIIKIEGPGDKPEELE